MAQAMLKRAPAGDMQRLHRFRDADSGLTAVKLLPGGNYVTADANEMLATVLGTCVAACMRDPVAGVGGMNHFMLPESGSGEWGGVSDAMRYGNFAMERLVNDILRQGGKRHRLEAKVFGGSRLSGASQIGERNADFVERYLKEEGIPVLSSLLRQPEALRVHYIPASGRAFVRRIGGTSLGSLVTEERNYRSRVNHSDTGGEVELFT